MFSVLMTNRELQVFHDSPEPSSAAAHATYLLCGELASTHANGDAMDVDGESAPHEEDGEQVEETRVTLVGEQDLDGTLAFPSTPDTRLLLIAAVKSTYTRIFSQHIYCLSPSAVIVSSILRSGTAILD